MAVLEEGFVGRNHIVLVGQRATSIEPVFTAKTKPRAGEKLAGIRAESLVEGCAEARGPAATPARADSESLRLRGVGVIESVKVDAEA